LENLRGAKSPVLQDKGALAQLGERRLCKPEVTGSIPVRSTQKGPGNGVLLFSGTATKRRVASGLARGEGLIVGQTGAARV
jgi:hypothetical protein